jgi:hypothetical protein
VPYNQPVPYDPQAAHRQQAAYNQQAARSQQPGAQQQAIQMQPQRQKQNPNFKQKQKNMYDRDGEEIVFKGVCDRFGVCCDVFWLWIFNVAERNDPALITAVDPSWLAVFHTGVSDVKLPILDGLNSTADTDGNTKDEANDEGDQSDDIFVCSGTKDVWVRMDPRKVDEYLGWCHKPLCRKLNCLVLSNVSNGHEFVAAVKRQMGQ